MVATTFAADTPLAVTGFVAKNGIAGNWLWWSFVMGGMMTVFFYARLWRRAGVMTDVEFAELRIPESRPRSYGAFGRFTWAFRSTALFLAGSTSRW